MRDGLFYPSFMTTANVDYERYTIGHYRFLCDGKDLLICMNIWFFEE